MRVILLQDVRSVGKRLEVKEVAEGYARNLLFPKGLAKAATPSALRDLEHERLALRKNEEETQKRLHSIAEEITRTALEFSLKTDEKGSVFGSVSKEAILKSLRDRGIVTKERVEIMLPHPLKELGEYTVQVDLKKGITARLRVVLRSQA
ncbi:50S ribosomal protein L9 [Candidatus Parcubacteria bacterium]|nr:MAG: 50S ribosomal protein L9 [Candidatus Parcubacteria bacterium]